MEKQKEKKTTPQRPTFSYLDVLNVHQDERLKGNVPGSNIRFPIKDFIKFGIEDRGVFLNNYIHLACFRFPAI